jgi:hypothetical protein
MLSTFSYFLIEETNVSLLETAIFGVQTLSAYLLCRFINRLDFHQTQTVFEHLWWQYLEHRCLMSPERGIYELLKKQRMFQILMFKFVGLKENCVLHYSTLLTLTSS